MRFFLAACALIFCASVAAKSYESPTRIAPPKNLERALDPNFSFRKFKIYTLSSETPVPHGQKKNPGDLNSRTNFKSKAGVQEASINYERAYRLHGAVTAYDQRERYGQYFDFFWRANQPRDVTVLFEYKQEKLRAFTQAQEISYRNVRGTTHTAFRVVGDEFNDHGQVLAWRCLLLEHGRIVAEKRSFLWD